MEALSLHLVPDDEPIWDNDPHLDPIGPHPFEPYYQPVAKAFDFTTHKATYVCGYRGCGASELNAIHV